MKLQEFLNSIDEELLVTFHLLHKDWGHLKKKDKYFEDIKKGWEFVKDKILLEYKKYGK